VIKDALFVVDDFAPHGSSREVTTMHDKAERLFRSGGNLGGRSRMTADTSLRPEYYPRGLVAASGEDVPRGHSLRARMVIDEIGRNDIDANKLRVLQVAAQKGLLAEALAGYVQSIAACANATDLSAELHRTQDQLCGTFTGDHRRTPAAAAALMLGVNQFLNFATDIGAISDLNAETLSDTVRAKLEIQTAVQANEQAQEDPVTIFVEAVPALLAAGRAHLTDKDGNKPGKADRGADTAFLFGWRKRERETFTGTRNEWSPQGDRIGFLVELQVWLLPEIAIAAINRLLGEQGRSLPIGRHTLGKRLREAGWLAETDKQSFTVVKRADGAPQRVFVFEHSKLFPPGD
jgi:hypothetical protein